MRAKNELVDALPYIDGGYEEPGVRDAVCLLFEQLIKSKSMWIIVWIYLIERFCQWLKKKRSDTNPLKIIWNF